MNKKILHRSGFTLLELLLVIAILVIIATIASDFFGSFMSGTQLEDNTKTIVYDLRNARDKAINGVDDRNWGAHFINGASDYYEIFSTPSNYSDLSKTILFTSYLKNGTTFNFPSEGNNFDVVFNKISGQVASSSVIIQAGITTRVISVQEQGLIN